MRVDDTKRADTDGDVPGEPVRGVCGASVVICAYTEARWEELLAAVDSARRQEPLPVEVLVVVDHNERLQARLVEALQAHDGAPVTVLANAGERGLSGARNTGVAAASGEVVAFLDDDACAHPGWLAALVAPFTDQQVAATGGTARPAWRPERPGWFPTEFDWVVGCSYSGGPDGEVEVRNPLGCNMAIRRSAFELVPGFADGIGRIGAYPLGCEETLFCISLRQADPTLRILHVPDAVVDHHVAVERHRFDYFRRRCVAEGLSKAEVTARVGGGDGLSTERGYVTRALPRAVVAGAVEALRRRELAPVARAAAVVTGLGFTTYGYLRASLRRRFGRVPVT